MEYSVSLYKIVSIYYDENGQILKQRETLMGSAPVPRDKWPGWARVIATRATPEDKGIGDVIARTIGDERSEKFKAFYMVTFGKPCGCDGRQKLWNQKYPLNLKAT